MDYIFSWIITNANGFIVSFLAGLITALFLSASSSFIEIFRFIFQKDNSIDGYWITSFPSIDGVNSVIEIIKIKSNKKRVKIFYQSYKFLSETQMRVRSGCGEGQYRPGMLISTYNLQKPYSIVLGAYFLKHFIVMDKMCLVGYYIQRADDNIQKEYISGGLAFIKINLPILSRIKFLYGPLFHSERKLIEYVNNEAKQLLNISNDLSSSLESDFLQHC